MGGEGERFTKPVCASDVQPPGALDPSAVSATSVMNIKKSRINVAKNKHDVGSIRPRGSAPGGRDTISSFASSGRSVEASGIVMWSGMMGSFGVSCHSFRWSMSSAVLRPVS